ESSSFLPAPPAGNARVRIGSQGGAAYLLQPSVQALGGGSELCLRAPTGGSLNKVQVHDHAPGSGFSLRCSMRISGDQGTVYFFTGNGSCFDDNGGFTSSEVFTGLRWTVDSSGVISCAARLPSGWSALPAASVHADSAFLLEVYCNNAAAARSYQHDSAQTVGAGRWDVWMDGHRVADELSATGLPDTLGIDSFMWYAAQSPANALTLSLDDIHYLNAIAVQPLPVELEFFHVSAGKQCAALRWRTASEYNSYGFVIERRNVPDGPWRQMEFKHAAGESASPRAYSWMDRTVRPGQTYRYRLLQQDRDGSFSRSPERELRIASPVSSLRSAPPWPQPARSDLSIAVELPHPATLQLRVHTLAGVMVTERTVGRLLPAGRHVLSLPCASWPRGLLLCELSDGTVSILHRILLE
ncbi:MAG: hypothetical protein RRA94_11160, partial [Bacteroidota bacterium]|nr:hypothetical protein [Bacteroidota bacterium]